MKKCLLVLCFFAAAFPLKAQQAETGLDGLELVTPLQLSGGTDHNFLVDPKAPAEVEPGVTDLRPRQLDDEVMLIKLPKIAYQNTSRRYEFTATWLPEFELFAHNRDQNAMNQEATGSFAYFLKRHLSVSIADRFESSHDPTRAMDNVFLLMPRANYRENDFRAALEYLPNPVTAISIRHDNSYTIFGQTGALQSRLLDSFAHGYSFSIARLLRPNQRIRGVYSIFKIQPVHQTPAVNDPNPNLTLEQVMQSLGVDYRWGKSPSTLIGLGGGIVKLDTGFNYMLRASLDKRIGTFWLGGGYARSLWFQNEALAFVPGVAANGFYDLVSTRFKGQPSANTAILVDTAMARAVSTRSLGSSKSLLGRARFDYRVTDRSVLFASFETFQQTRNVFVNAPLSRNRLMMGVEFSLSGETTRRLYHSREEEQYVALTDHRRQRPAPQQ